MRAYVLPPAFLVALSLCAAPAGAAAWNPGALLDRADLDNINIFGGFNIRRGLYVAVKGAKNSGSGFPPAASFLTGQVNGGDFSSGNTRSWYLGAGGPNQSLVSSTLMPPFFNGAILHYTTSSYGSPSGRFLQALLYQPDSVKRSTNNAGSKLLLKQKGSVGFRIGSFRGTAWNSTLTSSFQAPGCKAQANLSTKTTPPTTVVKFKVRCGNQGAPEQRVRDALEAMFGKKKNGFDLFRDTSKPL